MESSSYPSPLNKLSRNHARRNRVGRQLGSGALGLTLASIVALGCQETPVYDYTQDPQDENPNEYDQGQIVGIESPCVAGEELHAYQTPPILVPLHEGLPLDIDYLGVMLDSNFQKISTLSGTPTVIDGPTRTVQLNRVRVNTENVTDTTTAKALFSGAGQKWSANVSAVYSGKVQTAFTDALYMSHTVRFDASSHYKLNEITNDAAYIVEEIMYGAGFRTVLSTEDTTINLKAAASFGDGVQNISIDCTQAAVDRYDTLVNKFETLHKEAVTRLNGYRNDQVRAGVQLKDLESDTIYKQLQSDVASYQAQRNQAQERWAKNVECLGQGSPTTGGSGGVGVSLEFLRQRNAVSVNVQGYGVTPRNDQALQQTDYESIKTSWGSAVDGVDYIPIFAVLRGAPTYACVTKTKLIPGAKPTDLVIKVHSITPTKGAVVDKWGGLWGNKNTDQPQWTLNLGLEVGHTPAGEVAIWRDPVDVQNGKASQVEYTFQARGMPGQNISLKFTGTKTSTRYPSQSSSITTLVEDLSPIIAEIEPGQQAPRTWITTGSYDTQYRIQATVIRPFDN